MLFRVPLFHGWNSGTLSYIYVKEIGLFYEIDYNKTIEHGKLVIVGDTMLGRILHYLIVAGFTAVLCTLMMLSVWDDGNTPAFRLTIFGLLIFIAYTVFVIYKKTKEAELTRIDTHISITDNHAFISSFIEKSSKWNIVTDKPGYIIGYMKDLFRIGLNPPQITVLFFDNYILIHAMGHSSRGLRNPYLFSLKDLIKEIKKEQEDYFNSLLSK